MFNAWNGKCLMDSALSLHQFASEDKNGAKMWSYMHLCFDPNLSCGWLSAVVVSPTHTGCSAATDHIKN